MKKWGESVLGRGVSLCGDFEVGKNMYVFFKELRESLV